MNNYSIIQKDASGKFIRKYPSMTRAEQMTGVPRQQIADVAFGKIPHAKGFIFEFESQEFKSRMEKKVRKQKIDTLCWYCSTVSPVCPWKKNLTPVPGWEAHQTYHEEEGEKTKSFVVKSCPLFTDDG